MKPGLAINFETGFLEVGAWKTSCLLNYLYLFNISRAIKRISFVVSAAIGKSGRLIIFAVFDRVLLGAMCTWHFRMAIGIVVSKLLTSVAADYSYSLLYEFDWLIVQMARENPIGCCFVKPGFLGQSQFDSFQWFPIAFDNASYSDTWKIIRKSWYHIRVGYFYGTPRGTAMCSILSLALQTDESTPKKSAFHPCKTHSASSGVVNSRRILPRAVIKAYSFFLFGYMEANAFLMSMLSLNFWFVLMSNILPGSRFSLLVSVVRFVGNSFRLAFTLSA